MAPPRRARAAARAPPAEGARLIARDSRVRRLAASYEAAFLAYLREPSEATLRGAYELGRDAVTDGLSALDLAAVHHEAMLAALSPGLPGAEEVGRAASDFLVEALSAYEMVQRGFREERDRADAERRHAAMVRQLSSFLADSSLAVQEPGSLDEVLHLVAEHARELTGAQTCVVEATVGGERRRVTSGFEEEGDTFADSAPGRAEARAAPDRPSAPRSSLTARLTTLDGRPLGTLRLSGTADGGFTAVDEAIVVHLAEMASAALERIDRYAPR